MIELFESLQGPDSHERGSLPRAELNFLDSCVRGNDENGSFVIFYMGTMIDGLVKIKKFAIWSNTIKVNYKQ